MYDWLTQHKIPLGAWLKNFVDLLNEHAEGFFDFIAPLKSRPVLIVSEEQITALAEVHFRRLLVE